MNINGHLRQQSQDIQYTKYLQNYIQVKKNVVLYNNTNSSLSYCHFNITSNHSLNIIIQWLMSLSRQKYQLHYKYHCILNITICHIFFFVKLFLKTYIKSSGERWESIHSHQTDLKLRSIYTIKAISWLSRKNSIASLYPNSNIL